MTAEPLPSLEQLISQTSSISSPPLIYNRLNDAINHPRTSIKDIAHIISEDPGLTARILKLANSSLYGMSNVYSISRAVTLIGTREMRDLSLAVSMMQVFPGISEDLLNMSMYWQHSVACGIVARNIGIFLREISVERLFVAGILHDIGQLVMCTLIPETVKKMVFQNAEQREPLCAIEKGCLGFDHAQLGGALLHSWNIPQNITDLVIGHHAPSRAEKYPRETTIIHLADIICQALGNGTSAETYIPWFDKDAYEKLNLLTGDIETIVKQSELQLKDIFTIMQQGI